MARRAALWGLLLSVASSGARAQPPRLDLGLEAGGGLDGNVCTAPASDTDLVGLACGGERLVEGYGLVDPSVRLAFGDLSLRYDGGLRLYADSGLSQHHVAALAVQRDAEWLGGALVLRGSFARFEAFPTIRVLGGTIEGSGALRRAGFEAGARYRIGLRRFLARDDPADLDQWLLGTLAYRPAPLVRLGAGGEGRRRQAGDEALRAFRFAGLLWADLALGPLAGRLDLEIASRVFDDGRHDVEAFASATVSWRLATGLSIFVRGGHESVSSSIPDLSFSRPIGEIGLRLEREQPLGQPALPRYRPRPSGGGRWSFRARAPGARTVSVVGTFNDWDAARGRMRRAGRGEWTASFAMTPGRHRYVLVVDGAAVRPPDAEGYAPDGFGGEDGLLHVP